MRKIEILFAVLFCIAINLNCSSSSSNSESQGDTQYADVIQLSDSITSDAGVEDATEDVNNVNKYFAISFNDNSLRFFDRERDQKRPFFTMKSKGEISSLEYIRDKDIVVFSDLSSKAIIFVKDLKEVKRITDVGEFPYGIKYIELSKQLVVPDKNSNRIYIIDTTTLDFDSISPMTAGGNYPISICYDDRPLTQGLMARLFILDYGSLYVRAYDIFEKDNWALRGERLPTISEPMNIVCDSENRRLLIVNSGSNNISAFGLDDMVQIPNSPFEAGKNPTYAAVHRGSSVAYVTNTSDDSLTIFSTKEMKAKGGISFKPQDRPVRVYVNEEENRLYVLLSGAKALYIYAIDDPLMPEKISQIDFDSEPRELIYK